MKEFNILSFFENGEVLGSVHGSSPDEIYSFVCEKAKLPQGLNAVTLLRELSEREKILSTAVGNGIAIPHPRRPMLSSEDEGRIIVVYPETEIEMHAPDSRKVYALLVLLSPSSDYHLKALGSLSSLFGNDAFRREFQKKPEKEELISLVRKFI